MGTAYREGLSSYLMRLAGAHCVRPHAIIRTLMKPYLDTYCPGLAETNKVERWFNFPTFDGASAPVSAFVGALEALTLREDLASLTLVALDGLVPIKDLVARSRRWCPLCYREDRLTGTPHSRLLWAMQDAQACPIHKVRLVDHCGCAPEERLRTGEAKPSPSICVQCGKDLGRDDVATVAATREELIRATLIADFLLAAETDRPDSKKGLQTFLAESIRIHFDGNAAAFARSIDVGKTRLHAWLWGDHFPTFRALVSIAQTHGCGIMDVLAGRADAIRRIPDPGQGLFLPKRRGAPRHHIWPDVQTALEGMLHRPEPISMKDVARELGIADRLLRARFCALAMAISDRYLERKAAQARAQRDDRMERIRDAATAMATEGIRPTQRKVIQRAGLPYNQFWNDLDQVKQVCAQAMLANSH
jgi:AraC-like DNA-binding protein